MSTTLTIRLSDSLARQLEAAAEETGIAKARIVASALEERLARRSTRRPQRFMHLAGSLSLGGRRSERKGFSRG
jgi:predicted transcriptional regulator